MSAPSSISPETSASDERLAWRRPFGCFAGLPAFEVEDRATKRPRVGIVVSATADESARLEHLRRRFAASTQARDAGGSERLTCALVHRGPLAIALMPWAPEETLFERIRHMRLHEVLTALASLDASATALAEGGVALGVLRALVTPWTVVEASGRGLSVSWTPGGTDLATVLHATIDRADAGLPAHARERPRCGTLPVALRPRVARLVLWALAVLRGNPALQTDDELAAQWIDLLAIDDACLHAVVDRFGAPARVERSLSDWILGYLHDDLQSSASSVGLLREALRGRDILRWARREHEPDHVYELPDPLGLTSVPPCDDEDGDPGRRSS